MEQEEIQSTVQRHIWDWDPDAAINLTGETSCYTPVIDEVVAACLEKLDDWEDSNELGELLRQSLMSKIQCVRPLDECIGVANGIREDLGA